MRVTAITGEVAWRHATAITHPLVDDGVSPLPVRSRDEQALFALGVETAPAPNPIFRRRFTLPSTATSATLVAVGLGYGEFSINGAPVTSGVLDPAPTDYDRTILYRSYDVSGLLKTGENELRGELGRGFFATRGASTWAWNLAPWHREPTMLARLEWIDVDGQTHVIVSDDQWETAAGPVHDDVLYTGVTFDARAARDIVWEPATVVVAPAGVLRPASIPEIHRYEPIAPVASTTADNATIYNFGRILAGRLAFSIDAAPGARITVRYGEYLEPDGTVSCENVLAAGDAQTDVFIAAGDEHGYRWEPQFTYKGFQFASVAISGDATIHDVVAIPIHTDIREVGELDCDEPTLAWIDRATKASFLNNMHGIPTDTPIYEKNGWTADAHLATEAVLHHFDLESSFIKWLDDHVDAQAADGSVPQIIPTPGWGAAMDPTWSSSLVLIAWNLYNEYGRIAVLERFWAAMDAYARLAISRTLDAGGIWPAHSWGDWLAPGHQFAPEGPAPTTTMMVKHLADVMSLISAELSRDDDARRYAAAARQVADAYHRAYFDESSGRYVHKDAGYRQTMNVLPLAFDAVPPEHIERVANGLVLDVEHRTDGHLDCGSVGTKYLLPTLTSIGRGDLAVTVAAQQTRPGWGVWRLAGSDTLWESWDLNARSHNHYFLGSAAAWVQQHVAGLRAAAPGWKTIEFAPLVDARVRRAALSHQTPLGTASVSWTREERWEITLVVPQGARAVVRLADLERPLEVGPGTHQIVVDIKDAVTV